MGKFVPVVDTEAPKSERNDNSGNFKKHRKFDDMGTKVDRGWEQGKVGWGVQGNFGSSGKDTCAQVMNKAAGNFKMIKNEKGLWVKSTSNNNDTFLENSVPQKSQGRGGGIPVLSSSAADFRQNILPESSRSVEHSRRYSHERVRSRSGSRSRDRTDRGRHNLRTRSRSRSREHSDMRSRNADCGRYRSRSRSQDRDYDRYRRDRERGHRDHDRDYRDREDPRHYNEGGREKSTHRSKSYDSDGDKQKHTSRSVTLEERNRQHGENERLNSSSHAAIEHHKYSDAEESSAEDNDELEIFQFNAVQIINRFLDIFGDKSATKEMKLEILSEVFAEHVSVKTLKTQKNLMINKQSLLNSFKQATFHPSMPSRRVFISLFQENDMPSSISYCFDLHTPGTSPGLGDPTKDTCLLYKCENNVICSIFGGADKEYLASLITLTMARVLASEVWSIVEDIIKKDMHIDQLPEDCLHFHDYTNIEVIG